MHELSIAQALIEQVERVAREESARSVSHITVSVGTFSGVDPDALKLAFPVAAEDSYADGASLEIRLVESRVKCRACGRESSPEFPLVICQLCYSMETELIAGQELTLTSVELVYD